VVDRRGWAKARGGGEAGERDRKESGVTYGRNKCARVMLMANMVEEIREGRAERVAEKEG